MRRFEVARRMFAPRYAWAHLLALLFNLVAAWLQNLTMLVGFSMYVCFVALASNVICSIALFRGAQFPIWEAAATWSVLGTFALFMLGVAQPELGPVPFWVFLVMMPLSFLVALPVFSFWRDIGAGNRARTGMPE